MPSKDDCCEDVNSSSIGLFVGPLLGQSLSLEKAAARSPDAGAITAHYADDHQHVLEVAGASGHRVQLPCQEPDQHLRLREEHGQDLQGHAGEVRVGMCAMSGSLLVRASASGWKLGCHHNKLVWQACVWAGLSALGAVCAPPAMLPTLGLYAYSALGAVCMAALFEQCGLLLLLLRYPNNEHLYRMYARFLEHVKSDPWTAQKFTE
eukprot:191387-Pelagomonas_calceolata.AAC.2